MPISRGQSVTLLVALKQGRIVAPMLPRGSIMSEIFTQYLNNHLLPHMRPGNTRVMDNYSVHNTAALQQALANYGVQPIYLPPYSPEYHSIELAWSKINAMPQKPALRMFYALLDAVAQAIPSVDRNDVNN